LNSDTLEPGSADQPPNDTAAPLRKPRLADYLTIARFDHVTKHVFIIPGIILAIVLRAPPLANLVFPIIAGLVSAIAIASANYTINEWLDREFDAHHPEKQQRASVQAALSGRLVLVQYLALAIIGLLLALLVGRTFTIFSVLFLLSGVIYNIRPFRVKDRAYLDALFESLNNPIRLMLGWSMIDQHAIAPSSLLFAFWMGGAFLMTAKRLSEYREIAARAGLEALHLYRRSFRFYTAEKLIVACFLYAVLASFFISVFLIKYKIEYVLGFPLIAALFAKYLSLALERGSVAQKPERLFLEKGLMALSAATGLALLALTLIDLPILDRLSEPHYISIE